MVVKSIIYLVALLSLLINHGAKGHRLARELDYEKQFKLLQKPSVKTIKMKPSSFAFEEESTLSQEREVLTKIKSKGEGCPKGTIPIKRVSKDDFIKMKRFTEDYTSRIKSNSFENHFAVVQTSPNPSTKIYHGANAILSYHDPKVSDSQYTSGEVTVMNGDDTIKVGWTVNPTINKDNRTRMFLYFNAGQSHCFNMLCPGFVNVNHEFPVDAVLEPMSKKGVIRTRYFSIFKDPKDGNWWLITGLKKTVQGFWPGKIFNGLANSATFVSFGGEAYSPVDQPLPPMGNGYKGIAELLYAAVVHEITVLDENLKEDNDPKETETYYDDPNYLVTDYGWSNIYGRLMFYGGPNPQI